MPEGLKSGYALFMRPLTTILIVDDEPGIRRSLGESLSEEGYQTMMVYKLGVLQNTVRVTKMLLNKDYFVISACRPKAHDRVVATLSLKNIVMGSIIVDGSTFNSGGGSSDKSLMHNASGTRAYGDGNTSANNHQDLNDTICMLSRLLVPNMSVTSGRRTSNPTRLM